jgi:hypothetical protein
LYPLAGAAGLFIPALALCHRARLDYLFTFLKTLKTSLSFLTREELDKMTDVMTDSEIGQLVGTSRTAATYHRKKMGVSSWSQKHGKRRYEEHYQPKPGAKRAFSRRRGCNERCFASISTPESAYWLGLLAADGWVVTHHQKPQGVALALHPRDMELLRQYADFVGFRGEPLRTRPSAELYQVKITSELMAADVISNGVTPRKSHTLELPKISNDLKPHWLRGLFDGDGSVSVRDRSLAAQLTTASERLAEQLRELTSAFLPRPCSLGRDREAYVLRWYADNAIALAEYMYQGDPQARPRMERKSEVFFGFQGSGVGHS